MLFRSLIVKQGLQNAASTGTSAQVANSLPSYIATQLIPNMPFFTPELQRKAATLTLNYSATPNWNWDFLFRSEQEKGSRPIGAILNSSPSAGATGAPGTMTNIQVPGTGAELPESIDYRFTTVGIKTEYGKQRWAVQTGYAGTFFTTGVKSILFDNPFATKDIGVQLFAPGNGCTPAAGAANCAVGAVPAHGQLSTYPDNQEHDLTFAGAFDTWKKHVRVMGTATNGWIRQDDPFLQIGRAHV